MGVDCALVLLLSILFASNTIYGLASPFLPTFLEDKEIDSHWTGLIFSMYAVATTISAIFIGKYLDSLGHNRVIMVGSFLMSACIVCFGLIERLEEKAEIIGISLALRFG